MDGLGRMGNSPGTRWCARKRERRSETAEIEENAAGGRDGIGEDGDDWKSSGSIPWTEMERTTRRIFPCPQNGGGWSKASAPWRGSGGVVCGAWTLTEKKKREGEKLLAARGRKGEARVWAQVRWG
jgi:hypothetical protein